MDVRTACRVPMPMYPTVQPMSMPAKAMTSIARTVTGWRECKNCANEFAAIIWIQHRQLNKQRKNFEAT